MENIKIIECPRDAMQGIPIFIPTAIKVKYINLLLKVGFDTIDFGSFVSPKAIPQMKDTHKVIKQLDRSSTNTKLLAIVANTRGAGDACLYPEIDYLGYPFSISETFQLRNTNSTILESVERVKEIQEICVRNGKRMVVYVSMGFGNPYGDPWNVDICQQWIDLLANMDIKIIALSDTIGVATPESISYLYKNLIPPYPDVEFGAHLHTLKTNWKEKIEAAYLNGCIRFDAAIRGYGGCPMAKDDLTGNMPTENIISYFSGKALIPKIDIEAFQRVHQFSSSVFN